MSAMMVEIGGVKMEVEFDFYPGYRGKRDSMGAQEEPDEGPEIDLTKVMVGDADILGLMSVESLREIERRILSELKSGGEDYDLAV